MSEPLSHLGLPVHGYRSQSSRMVDLVNRNKVIEEKVLRILDELDLDHEVDPGWLAIGRRHIEQGFMAVNRACFKPARASIGDDQ